MSQDHRVNIGPVIERELRAESRRPVNHWLRVLAAAALILVFASLVFGTPMGAEELGAILFAFLHRTLLLAFWIVVPLMTADCVSREKREGTIGLLFLTPLTVLDVIVGKASIHVLRAFTLFLAAVPILGLPLVLGGVSWPVVAAALIAQADAVLLAIAAGIYASTRGGSTIQAMVLAEGCSLGLAIVSNLYTPTFDWLASSRPRTIGMASALGLGCSVILFLRILQLSVRRLQRTWQHESAAPEQPAWVKLFSDSEFWRQAFHWNKGRTLDRNPMAWLQEYSWTARLTKWGWFFLVMFAQLVVLTDAPTLQPSLNAALALGMAFSAVGSFRREHETGLLELLLVTPLTVRQLVGGRIWGICCHYVPAIALLSLGLIGAHWLNPRTQPTSRLTLMFPNPITFASMTLLGVYLSLGRLNFLLAWLLTWVIGFLLPTLLALFLCEFAGFPPLPAIALPSAGYVVMAVAFWALILRKVHRRTFLGGKADRQALL